jgi:hypothetical protein
MAHASWMIPAVIAEEADARQTTEASGVLAGTIVAMLAVTLVIDSRRYDAPRRDWPSAGSSSRPLRILQHGADRLARVVVHALESVAGARRTPRVPIELRTAGSRCRPRPHHGAR